LAKSFNRFYNELPILKETDTHKRNFRLQLCQFNAQVMQHALGLLGIETVEKM
jgi:arginyl-tRNA synthetase